MRTSAALAALAIAAAAWNAAATPRRPRPAPADVSTSASASGGVVALRAPGAQEILIRGGSFIMGSSDVEVAHAVEICKQEAPNAEAYCREDDFLYETAAHEVFLSDYWLDRTEVTVARYRRCVAAGPCVDPPYGAGATRFDHPGFPVVLVTYADALAFCAWAGGRLPTEAEWERAARGLSGRRYPWGNVYNPFLANHGKRVVELDDSDGFLEIAPVGSFPEGRTPDGLDDMAGNVAEWVSDWFAKEYPKLSVVDPKGPDEGDARVIRGGRYSSSRPWLRGAARDAESPGTRRASIGFRCARSAK